MSSVLAHTETGVSLKHSREDKSRQIGGSEVSGRVLHSKCFFIDLKSRILLKLESDQLQTDKLKFGTFIYFSMQFYQASALHQALEIENQEKDTDIEEFTVELRNVKVNTQTTNCK